jgi:hypothetical protein
MRISSAEYRDFARQYLRWAAHTTREDHKNIMLQMAKHWLQVAEDIEDSAGQRKLPKVSSPKSYHHN